MRRFRGTAAARIAAAVVACTAFAAAADAQARPTRATRPLPASKLTVWDGAGWREWWRAARAPARWTDSLSARTGLQALARWREAAPGVEWAELRLAGSGEAWRTRAVLVRLDPARVRLRLEVATSRGATAGGWTIDRAPASAIVALNAGQFTGASPWGWLVRDGRELLSPGRGPLAPAVVVDTAGRVTILDAARIAPRRGAGDVAQAFQSYPALLLQDAAVPAALRANGPRVDVAHRDARLAIGLLADGRVLVALTRFDALGGALDAAPFGLTTPEMAALMGALGARRAVALDGGISAQLLVRDAEGEHRWPGMRAVPLGLVVERR